MINPASILRTRQRKLKKWRPKKSWNIPKSESLDPNEIAAQLIKINNEPWITKGYALISYLVAAGQLLRAAESIVDLWGDMLSHETKLAKNMDLEILAEITQNVPVLLGISRGYDGYNELVSSIIAITEPSYFSDCFFNTDQIYFEELRAFDILASFEQSRSLEICTNLYFDSDFKSKVVSNFRYSNFSFLDRLNEYEKENINYFLQNLRNQQLIFSWIKSENNENQIDYIKKLYSKREGELMKNKDHLIDSIFNSISPELLDSDSSNNLRYILSRIIDVINESSYDFFSQAVTASHGQSGRDSMVGNTSPINIVPSYDGKYLSCEEICLMVAKGRNARSMFGFKNVIRDLRLHLLRCRNTKIVLMLHDDWDNSAVNESKLDIQHHQEFGVTFIRLLVNGGQITHVPNLF